MKVCLIFKLILLSVFLNYSSLALSDIIDSLEDLEQKEKPKRKPPKKQKKPLEKVIPTVEAPVEQPDNQDQSPKTVSKETRQENAKEPVKLKGDGQSTYSRKNGVMTLKENVVITQGNLRLQSDEAVVTFYKVKKDSDRDEVKQVEITGHVKVSKFDPDPAERMVAHGDRAIFLNSDQKVRLIGNARLYRGGDLMKGRQITYDIPTGMVIVDQAQGIVQPKENK